MPPRRLRRPFMCTMAPFIPDYQEFLNEKGSRLRNSGLKLRLLQFRS